MRLFVLTLSLLFCLMSSAFAHAGATDSYGGHYDRSTGEYHYHHGYSAHPHINGYCPYNHNDRTGELSGSASGVSTTWAPNVTKQPVTHKVVYTATPTPTATLSPSFTERFVAHMYTLPIWVLPSVASLITFLLMLWWHHCAKQIQEERLDTQLTNLKEKHEQEISQLNSDHKQILESKSIGMKTISKQYVALLDQYSELLKQNEQLQTQPNLQAYADLLQAEYKIALGENKLSEFYQAHSLREIANMPADTVIGTDVLPKVRGAEQWGDKYTFYFSGSSSKRYHRKNCKYAYFPFNAFTYPDRNIPCGVCNPPPRPDTAWFKIYMEHRRNCIKNGYTPRPNDIYPETPDNNTKIKFSLRDDIDF